MIAWKRAIRAMSWKTVGLVWIGTLLLVLLSVLWLQIPDSHVWQFILSMLCACGMVCLLLWFCCEIFSRIVGTSSRGYWWLRWVLIIAVIALWWLLQMPIDRLAAQRELYAGYWTSRLPHWLRGSHTYEHLLLLLENAGSFLQLLFAGLLLPIAMSFGAGIVSKSITKIVGVWAGWWYWVAVIAAGWLCNTVWSHLTGWTLGHGLAAEILSLVLRLGTAFTLLVLIACFVLQLIAVAFSAKQTLEQTS